MKLAKAGFLAAVVLVLSTAGQAAAAGIQIDGNGRQVDPVAARAYGIAIDPDGRAGATSIDPVGRDGGSAIDPAGRGWLSALLHRWFGWV